LALLVEPDDVLGSAFLGVLTEVDEVLVGIAYGLFEPLAGLCEILMGLTGEVFVGAYGIDIGNPLAGEVLDSEFAGVGSPLGVDDGEHN